jgi:hypothetical protein
MTEAKTTSAETVTGGPTSLVVTRFDDLGKVIIKAVAIVTAIISVVVPLTEYIRGYSNQKISQAERNSKLASEFLDKIAAKDISSPDRLMYLSALAKLKDHPLQAWAEEQRSTLEKEVNEMRARIVKARIGLDGTTVANSKVLTIKGEIDLALLALQQARSPAEVEAQRKKLEALDKEMATAKADVVQQQQVVQRAWEEALKSENLLTSDLKEVIERYNKTAKDIVDTLGR